MTTHLQWQPHPVTARKATTRPHTHGSGCVVLIKVIGQKQQNDNLLNEPPPHPPPEMKMRPANDGWPAKTQTEPHTHFSGCVIALSTDGTTHPLRQVPSLCENPPDKDMDEPPVCGNIRSLPYVKTHLMTIWMSPQYTSQCTATQASSAHPLNMTIDKIAYHTPAAAARKSPTQKRDVCSHLPPATRNPIQEPSARTPATYTMMDEIWYHTPTAAGLPSMHKTPPNKNTANFQDEKEMCAATHNPIPEPVTMGQNEYHTCFEAPEMMTHPNDDPRPVQTTPPTVNRQASLPPMATNEPAEPLIQQRKAPHTP
ncbi:hypothetical protein BS47DRAFT_1366043 [Hydnum rufescens UP504]|uniref:Uncharacterized protein n=1 Tax=Hydnum rufescens UP504 TaxID=1448309 RepID=A0A9P6AP38_9AGAM|nr:hypothetical protein BS47DRAFT_1366043 [Hydnum rufescens UP504]